MRRTRSIWLALAMMTSLTSTGTRTRAASLIDGFSRPPADTRPWVYWFVMDGNFTREGITADLEAMSRAGIGGVIFMEVNARMPRGPVKFMSPQWRELFKHADADARRLGLSITLNAGPGWTGSGGPWVKPEQSMQHLVASATQVAGPAKSSGLLPQPPPRRPYFSVTQPSDLVKARDAFYVDVMVLAVPRTVDSARIADLDEKALFLRHPYSSRPNTKPFFPSPASFPALSAGAVIPLDRVMNLSAHMDKDGRLTWDVPPGEWTLLRFGRTSTGANNRPAPLAGIGLECDKMDRAALDAHFESFIGALLEDLGPRDPADASGLKMLHIDSWEMGAQNWTASFATEFRLRRGYDLTPYLPAMTGRVVGSLEISERFLWDLRQTAQELVIENYAQHLKELGRKNGLGLSIEPYDMNPCSDMSLGSVADVPMCEFWLYGFKTWFSVFEAASIAHTTGKPIVAAEAFTSTAAERWQAHPGSMKTLGDWAFCAGVNRIVFHRYQHQPTLDQRPGMTMGQYGVHWESTQTWWDMAHAYHEYLARCQYMLRQGLPVADLCFLVAEGAPHVFRPPTSATRGDPPDWLGYSLDGCAPETLVQRMSVRDGKLVLPDGTSYRVLVLPQRDTMTPRLLRKIKQLVAAGATVIGPRPQKSPSLNNYPACDREVQDLADELWGPQNDTTIADEYALGKGRVIRPPIVADARPAQAAPPHPLQHAKWIWHKEGNPALQAPVAKRYFRRVFTLEPGTAVESARIFMTADNEFELSVNGRPVGTGDSFHEVSAFDVAAILKPGANVIAVCAENGGDDPNPAGLIGALVARLRGGQAIEVATDAQWLSATAIESNWRADPAATSAWQPALELGTMSMAPWNFNVAPPIEPQQYCSFTFIADVLTRMAVTPDFESDGPIRYTHRRDGDTDLYFVANREERALDANCTFRVSGKTPELWDPLIGRTRALPQFTIESGRTRIPMRFEPAQSFFVVFRNPLSGAQPQGQNFTQTTSVAELSGPWEVSFDPKWGGPQSITFQNLDDWRDRPEPGVRFYSGVATYRKSFDLPAATSAAPLYLNLGVVKNLARVHLNGRDLGVVWCAPWQVDITDSVKSRGNQLEITVANLWPNRLIGDQSLPPEKRFASTTWNPFKKDSPLLESGLLGPVTIRSSASGQARDHGSRIRIRTP